VFEPELLYNIFKIVFAINMKDIEIFDKVLDIGNKIVIFFAVFNNCAFSSLNIFFEYQKFHNK